jgi:NAD(P)-dependent dehydrogenase (short-subunit alcohol dehydrogenase family)
MAGRVAGKKALITGGAQGLGAAFGRRLAEEGAKVALTDLNLEGAQAVAAEIDATHGPGTAFAYRHDVTSEEQWIEVLAQADAAMGGISVLVNNAGIGLGGHIEELSYDDWKKVMSVNVDSVFLGTKHALKYLRQNQPGSIVNISSIAGLIAAHNTPSYNASKAAVWLLSKGIALHCAKQSWTCAATRAPDLHRHADPRPPAPALRQGRGRGQARPAGAARPHRRDRPTSPTPCSTSPATRAAS